MKCLFFKKWIESQTLGGGLSPPKQSPVDPSPAPGQTNAFPTYSIADEPPTKRNKFRMKSKMKSKMKKV
jgi:hypothetical protein